MAQRPAKAISRCRSSCEQLDAADERTDCEKPTSLGTFHRTWRQPSEYHHPSKSASDLKGCGLSCRHLIPLVSRICSSALIWAKQRLRKCSKSVTAICGAMLPEKNLYHAWSFSLSSASWTSCA